MIEYIERLLQGAEVQWKTLGEVITLEKGKQLNKSLLKGSGEYPAYNGGLTYSGFTDKYNYSENKTIISQGGASAGFVNFITTKFYANAHCYVVLPNIDVVENKYVYYLLKMNQENLINRQLGAGIPSLHTEDILGILIPIPPLEVQREIVRILDKFTELEAELEAELECRRKQYGYYRDKLLSEEYLSARGVVEWKMLGEVVDIVGRIGFRGYTNKDFVEKQQGAITISPANIKNQSLIIDDTCKYISWEKYEESPEIKVEVGDILLAKTASVGKVALVNSLEYPATINPQLVLLKRCKILPAYLCYYMTSFAFQNILRRNTSSGTVPNISQSLIKKLLIPIPPLSVQREVVRILDKFDTLTTSISEGLPREIKLRRKQYEYYREQLLNFTRN
jgi:hypothetical protein